MRQALQQEQLQQHFSDFEILPFSILYTESEILRAS